MAYFEDLSAYEYLNGMFFRPGTNNVGWLGLGHGFEMAEPSEELLERLWQYCKVSVAQTRGVHDCEFCLPDTACRATRRGEELLLGTSEIRVFGNAGEIYAAPTLLYHYVFVHHYRPPDQFVQALMEASPAPDELYFAHLARLGLEWNKTSIASGPRMRLPPPKAK